MKNYLNFLIETSKLKEMPRTGWIIRGLKNPETIADHMFRVAFFSWILGAKKHLNISKVIKTALSHDICEVYAGDMTPFFYYLNLPKSNIEKNNVLRKWVRLLQKEKEKRGRIKFEIEKKSLLKLLSPLEQSVSRSFFSAWIDYEHGVSKEGKFVRQLDVVETLLQAIEYLGAGKDSLATGWWEESEERVEDPLLLEFLHTIQNKFYKKNFPGNKKLENDLDFLLNIGKLKRMSRLYWTLREVKQPETVAGHIFTLALMVLLFGREKKHLNMEKMLKMALCHEITAVYTKDTIPYYVNLPENKKEREEIFKTLPHQFKNAKVRKFSIDYKLEEKAIKKVVSRLEPSLQKEIIQLWHEYRNKSSAEGLFLSQLNVLAVLLQALIYKQKNKKFSVQAIWEMVFEVCDEPICIQLMDEMKRKFK